MHLKFLFKNGGQCSNNIVITLKKALNSCTFTHVAKTLLIKYKVVLIENEVMMFHLVKNDPGMCRL